MIALVHDGISCFEEATRPGHLIELIPWSEFVQLSTVEITANVSTSALHTSLVPIRRIQTICLEMGARLCQHAGGTL